MNQNGRLQHRLAVLAVTIVSFGLTAQASETATPRQSPSSATDTMMLALEGSRPPEGFDPEGIDTRVDNEHLDMRKATDGIDTNLDQHGLTQDGVESDFETDGVGRDDIDTEGIDTN